VNATTRRQHPNAPLTPEGRRRMVRCVTDQGWTVEATAERFQVDAKTVRKWRDRWLVAGDDGLCDRSSRPHRSPNRTRRQLRRKVCRIRKEAYVKAKGMGLSMDLGGFTVPLLPAEPARLISCSAYPQDVERWGVHGLSPAAGYTAAVAAEDVDTVREFAVA
jgi:transposase-like protein